MKLLRVLLVGAFLLCLLGQTTISGGEAPQGAYVTGPVLLTIEEFTCSGTPIAYGQKVRLGQAVGYEILPLALPDVTGKSPYEQHLLEISAIAGGDHTLLYALHGGGEVAADPTDAAPAAGIFAPDGIVTGEAWYTTAQLSGGSPGDTVTALLLSGVFREAEFTLVEKSPGGLWLLRCGDCLEAVCTLKEITFEFQ